MLIKVTLGLHPGAGAGSPKDQFVIKGLELLVLEGRRAGG